MRNVCCEVFYAETRQMVCRTNKKRTHTFIAKRQASSNSSKGFTRVMDCLLHNDPASCGIWQG